LNRTKRFDDGGDIVENQVAQEVSIKTERLVVMGGVKITVEQAARQMGVPIRFLHLGLQHNKFPFGTAIKGRKRWSYYINRARFDKWMAGDDMVEEVKTDDER
jgi:hypothetical protein